MPTNYLTHSFNLKEAHTGKAINSSGGKAIVMTASSPELATLFNPDSGYVALTNPITANRGYYKFAVLDTVLTVDIAVQAPGGQFMFLEGVSAQERTEYTVDVMNKVQVYKLPFSFTRGAAVEIDTGIDLPQCEVLPQSWVKVTTADAGISIEVGLLSSEASGDADGFIDAVSTATATLVKPTILNGANTLGALNKVQDSANAGDLTHEPHVVTAAAAVSVTWTLLVGADTAKGYFGLTIVLP